MIHSPIYFSKRIFQNSVFYFMLFVLGAVGQVQSEGLSADSTSKNQQNVLGFLPSKYEYINGIAIGLVGSEVYCDYKISKISNGLNLQFGQGLFLSPMLFYNMSYMYRKDSNHIDSMLFSIDTSYFKAKHNGLLISLFGSATDKINGMAISSVFSSHKKMNGLSISLLGSAYHIMNGVSISIINKSISSNGVQIGLYNNSLHLHGLQIGLWNRNKKRSLPFVNW